MVPVGPGLAPASGIRVCTEVFATCSLCRSEGFAPSWCLAACGEWVALGSVPGAVVGCGCPECARPWPHSCVWRDVPRSGGEAAAAESVSCS